MSTLENTLQIETKLEKVINILNTNVPRFVTLGICKITGTN